MSERLYRRRIGSNLPVRVPGNLTSVDTGIGSGWLEFAGLENDGLENDGVEQEQTYILHRMKNFNVYDM